MTKKELIERLAEFPDDMEVLVRSWRNDDGLIPPWPSQEEAIDQVWEEYDRYCLDDEYEGTYQCCKTEIYREFLDYPAETGNRRKVILL